MTNSTDDIDRTAKGREDHDQGHGNHGVSVAITLDGHRKEIPKGNYLVSEPKEKLGVPADYELDEVVGGEFRPLDDASRLHIKGGEHFISHVRRGGSS